MKQTIHYRIFMGPQMTAACKRSFRGEITTPDPKKVTCDTCVAIRERAMR